MTYFLSSYFDVQSLWRLLSPFDLSFPSIFVKGVAIFGLIVYMDHESSKRKLYKCANYIVNKYLDLKYRNYQLKQSEKSKYVLYEIHLLSLNNPTNIITEEIPLLSKRI